MVSAGDHHWQKAIFQDLLMQNFSGKQLGTNGQLLAPIMCRIAIGIIRNEFETVKINCLLLAYLGKRIGLHINKIARQLGRRADKLIASATA